MIDPSCYILVTERMREMDWHPNADEWSYLEAKPRMTVFDATSTPRTFDYERWGNRKHRVDNRPIAQRLQQSQVRGYFAEPVDGADTAGVGSRVPETVTG